MNAVPYFVKGAAAVPPNEGSFGELVVKKQAPTRALHWFKAAYKQLYWASVRRRV